MGFEELMKSEFGFLVTPIAFNVTLNLQEVNFQIEKGFGSPELNHLKEGQVKISTEFPNLCNSKGQRKGGILLFKLKKQNESNSVSVTVGHEDLQGIQQSEQLDITFGTSPSMRKAILLVRYTDFVQGKERCVGLTGDYLKERDLRREDPKRTSDFRQPFTEFIKMFQKEKELIQDSFEQEEEILVELASLEERILQLAKFDRQDAEREKRPLEEPSTPSSSKVVRLGIESSPSSTQSSQASEGEDCVICLSSPRRFALSPCGHLCVCSECLPLLQSCPLCRSVIESSLSVFT